jgi:hypothetical protein
VSNKFLRLTIFSTACIILTDRRPNGDSMPTAPQNPAEYIISLFGGVRATARALKMTGPSVGYWRRKGYVPNKNITLILAVCRDMGIRIDRNKLVPR